MRTARHGAVAAILLAYASSDETAIRALCTEDVAWWVPPSAEGRYPRPIIGIDAVVGVLAGPSQAYDKSTIAWTIHHVVGGDEFDAEVDPDADIVMANATMTATLRNGNDYRNQYCYVFRFAGVRIAEATEYADTACAATRAAAPR